MARKNLKDAFGFWLTLAGVLLAAAAIAVGVATAEYHPPWKSLWFATGAAAGVAACVLALWSLVLYLAHNLAEQHACPDPAAHVAKNAPTRGAGQAQLAGSAEPSSQRATPTGALDQPRSEPIEWLRPLLREISGDLRQGKAGIRRIGETGYGSVTSEFNPSDAWTNGRERLAADASLGNLYDLCRDAYGCLERMRLTALAWGLPSSRLQAADTAIRKIRLARELQAALKAIDTAQDAVQERLSELDERLPEGRSLS